MVLFSKSKTDQAATPANQERGGVGDLGSNPTPLELAIPLHGIPLASFAQNNRFYALDKLEAYYRATQDEHKRYDWDGRFAGYDDAAQVAPGWVVPYKSRQPSARYDLGRVIVTRLTSLIFGADHFPELRVEGDEEAESFVRALCETSLLPMRIAEARDLGGSVGSVGMSFAFVNGHPRVEVHNAKHLTVLRWKDENTWEPAAVLKTYAYVRRVFDPGTNRMKDVTYYYARYWDEAVEIVWEPIREDLAKTTDWGHAKKSVVAHGFGFTPFYWIQNEPDSTEPDGFCDYEGLCGNFDELNQLFSAASKGTKANCDPTLVIHMDPSMNGGSVRKGSDAAIYSEKGAKYLELSGTAVEAAMKMMKELRAASLDVASVVLADPEKLSGAAQSAAAMGILYQPMLAKCNIRRETYGNGGIKDLLLGMLRAAKTILARAPGNGIDAEGNPTLEQPAILLPKRVKHKDVEEAVSDLVEDPLTGGFLVKKKKEVEYVDQTPGELEELTLNWPPYFSPTWADIDAAAKAVTSANGGKPVISQRTAVQAVQTLFGIQNVDNEMSELEHEGKRAIAEAQALMPQNPDDEGFGSEK